MTIGYWDVIQSEDGEKFACQRTPVMGDLEFETSCWLDSEAAAEALCDELNADVEDEISALPDHLRPA